MLLTQASPCNRYGEQGSNWMKDYEAIEVADLTELNSQLSSYAKEGYKLEAYSAGTVADALGNLQLRHFAIMSRDAVPPFSRPGL